MWGHSNIVWAVLVGALLLIGSFAVVIGAPPEERPNASEEPDSQVCWGGSSERTVVVEKFTADWCQYCPPQAFALNRLSDELGTDNIVVLEHHPSSSDAAYYGPSNTRRQWYGVTGYPTTIVDGGGYYSGAATGPGMGGATLWTSGGTQKWQLYFDDRDAYQKEKDRTTNLTISLTGNITSSQGRVNVHIVATDPITETDLNVRFMVIESNINLPLNNGGENFLHHRVYNHVVRLILADYVIPDGTFNMGDVLDIERTFTINAGWDIRTLGFAAFVQSDNRIQYMYGNPPSAARYNAPILQGAVMEFVPTGILVVDGNDLDNLATDFDHYDELLTYGHIPHHNWDTFETKILDTELDNYRTMPTFADLQEYSAVIWFTGTDSSTLAAASRTAIQEYLDYKGNLLITGEEIANDANMNGWTGWLSGYLYAAFVADNGPGSSVEGVPGDPITSGLSSVGITHSSPDVIDVSGSNEIFVYSISPTDIAGVRAVHDSDSRVIYDSFDYFEGTDIWDGNTQDELILRNMLNWLDYAAPPDVDVILPDGGEVIDKVTDYEIRWSAFDVEMPETPVSIDYTTDSSSPVWIPIATNEPNDGFFIWTTPNLDTTKARVRVCAVDSVGQSNCVMSDGDFTIGVPPTDTDPPNVYEPLLNGKVTETVNPGDLVDFTAVIEDGFSPVGGANYTIDGSPGGPMMALNGMFDELNETAIVTIDTAGWSEAVYSICVSEAWDELFNYNVSAAACAPLDVTLTPLDKTPPEIYNVRVNGEITIAIPVGTLVTLTATVTDQESNILSAEYTVNGGPVGAMDAVDGAYDSVAEDVIASIDTTGWPEDTYTVCVHATDSAGNTNSTGDCAQIVISSDFWPPEIRDVFINGLPIQSWDYKSLPPDFYVTAVIDDTTTGNNNIEEANYTVGPSNWPSRKMFPVDIVYDEPLEDVQQVATTPVVPGVYEYCVYALDNKTNANWTGSCATLNIVDTDPPAVLNVLVNGSKTTTVILGDPVTLEATIDDASTGGSSILRANFTDGMTNWASSVAMLPADGSFNSPIEDVNYLIDTSTWSIGLHTICVYAEDEWGNANLSSSDCVQMDLTAIGPIPPIMLDAQLTGVGLADVLATWQASGDDGAGLDNVIEYEVYTSNLYTGPYSLATTIPATDQPTYQYTCTGCGYGDTNNHFFYVRAYNGLEYSTSPNRAGKFTRHLTAGVQLVSIPLTTSDTSIAGVLQTIQLDKVWTYDAMDAMDPWKWYEEVKPYKGDLWTIDHKKAFWVNVLADDDLVVAGLVPVLTQIQLKAGWNLVSFPSFNPLYTVGQLKMDIGVVEVEGFDPSVPYCMRSLLDTDMITAGKGFWVYVSADTMWNIIQ